MGFFFSDESFRFQREVGVVGFFPDIHEGSHVDLAAIHTKSPLP
jgi:hypothetical protein